MGPPMHDKGALLVDEEGVDYLVLSCFRTGHQYDRHWGYSVLTEGRIINIDDYDLDRKKVRKALDTTTKNSQ